jgi:hypothetical protein
LSAFLGYFLPFFSLIMSRFNITALVLTVLLALTTFSYVSAAVGPLITDKGNSFRLSIETRLLTQV